LPAALIRIGQLLPQVYPVFLVLSHGYKQEGEKSLRRCRYFLNWGSPAFSWSRRSDCVQSIYNTCEMATGNDC